MDPAILAAIAAGNITVQPALLTAILAGNVTLTPLMALAISEGMPVTLDYLHQNRSRTLINVVIAFSILEILFVALFYYTRFKFKALRGIDLYLMVPAFIAAFAHLVFCSVMVDRAGLGRHALTLSPDQIVLFLKFQIVFAMVTAAAVTFPKLCILSLYLRAFSAKAFRYGAFIIASIIFITWIVAFAIQMRMCVPFRKQYHPEVPGTCMNSYTAYFWLGFPGIITDLMIILLPLPFIWRLQTTTNQKIGLTATFLTGSIGIITAIIRFAEFSKLTGQVTTNVDFDFSWIGQDAVMWTSIEPGVYLIAACLPSLRPLYNTLTKDISLNPRSHLERLRRERDEKNLPTHAVTIQLGDPTSHDDHMKTHKGFSRLTNDELRWPSQSTNCFGKYTQGSDDKELGSSEEARDSGFGGIVVMKEYTISTEPIDRIIQDLAKGVE